MNGSGATSCEYEPFNQRNYRSFPGYDFERHDTASREQFLFYQPGFATSAFLEKISKRLKTKKFLDMYGDSITTGEKQYQILEFIEHGAFGVVLKCKEGSSHQTVAIKISNKSNFDAYSNECGILTKLRRANPDKFHFLRLLDSFRCDDALIMVSEMLGKSLRDRLIETMGKPFFAWEVGLIAEQLLAALQKLQELKIVHGDVKPENILFVNQGRKRLRIKLIDFGMSVQLRKSDPGSYLKELPEFVQTVPYRSPEVMLCLPFTEAIDMWSTGCILAELLLGETLYPGSYEYDVWLYIYVTQGVPPSRMMNQSTVAEDCFNRIKSKNGRRGSWQIKPPEQYEKETGYVFEDTRVYKLHDLSEIARVNPRITPRAKFTKEMVRRSACVNLIKKMMALDDRRRISPKDALAHSFISRFYCL